MVKIIKYVLTITTMNSNGHLSSDNGRVGITNLSTYVSRYVECSIIIYLGTYH